MRDSLLYDREAKAVGYVGMQPHFVKHTYIEVSLSHVTQEDSVLLETIGIKESKPIVYSYEYGFFIPIFANFGRRQNYAYYKELGYSDAFVNLLEAAKSNGCKFLRLDRDTEPNEDLEQFDW